MKMFHIIDKPPLYTNTFLLIGNEGHAVAIDPAADVENYTRLLDENNATLTHILLTHGHFDHVGAVEPLRQQTGAKLWMNAADAAHFKMTPDKTYTDGGTVTVDDMTFQTIFTPGHTPGSTCLLCGDLLFSGDTLFAGDIGRTDLPGGDARAMRQSLDKLRDAVPGEAQVLPGHEEFSTMAQEKAHNPYLKRG